MNDFETPGGEQQLDIAIIGMAGRFPQARNVDEYWSNLRNGVESIVSFTPDELREAGVSEEMIQDPDYVPCGAVLDDIDLFDAAFFGLSPREAQITDPQQRLFLECAWELIESAGYNPETYAGLIGVYAGSSLSSYLFHLLAQRQEVAGVDDFQAVVGNESDFLATRASYKLNLRGPSVSVQTGCSTSMVAIQMACQSLLSYQCDMVIAGGSSVRVPQKRGYIYHPEGILSQDGHCRAFDEQATGVVDGSGVGVVLLKRLADALADGDQIHAVIKGSAINNDGSAKIGFTAPGESGEAEVITEALAMGDISPESISYVETHGTGTPLGDPIEISALTKAFRLGTAKKQYCAIGSVKTNIGHLDTAAGVAGLIKTVQMLKHKEIPPSLHFQKPNPKIDFVNSPFFVNNELRPWVAEGKLRAGVSSFGIGGTNVHLVLEEAPAGVSQPSRRQSQLLLLSARTETALETAQGNLAGYLHDHPTTPLADVAYTLQVGRQAFHYRSMLLCRDTRSAAEALHARQAPTLFTSYCENTKRPVVFLFPGGGTQYIHMGRHLYETEQVFQEQVDLCANLLFPLLGRNIREALYLDSVNEEMRKAFRKTGLALPSLFAIEYALARLLMSWGITPQALIGHSLGEYTAACLAGVFSLEDALKLVVKRSLLFETLPDGAMVSVPLSADEIRPLLNEHLSIAAINAPSQCVIAGSNQHIQEFEALLKQLDKEYRSLHIDVAAHSLMVEPILTEFERYVTTLEFKAPQIPIISNVTGTWMTREEATDPQYWTRHLRQTVQFGAGMQELLQEPEYALVEVGPGQALSTLTRQQTNYTLERVILPAMRHPQSSENDMDVLFTLLGRLWLAGVSVDWEQVWRQEKRQRLVLPTYPFERQRFWVDAQQPNIFNVQKVTKGSDLSRWFYIPSWKQSLPPVLSATSSIGPGHALCFVDEHGLASQLLSFFQSQGQTVTLVQAGQSFIQHENGSFTLNPAVPEQYMALIQALQAHDAGLTHIFHFWSLKPPGEGLDLQANFASAQECGFYSLLYLAQALSKQHMTQPLQLWVIGNNIHDIVGTERLLPEHATLLAACRVIPQEFPSIQCRCLEVYLEPEPKLEQILTQIQRELQSSVYEPLVVYRGKHRWLPNFEQYPLPSPAGKPARLKHQGVYLITGGFGLLGQLLSRVLAKTVQARLVLTVRQALPEREVWDTWLEMHPEDDRIARRICFVRELEACGSQVLIVEADVTSYEQMQAALEKAKATFGPLNGAIHAAGAIGMEYFHTIQETSFARCQTHFAAKVYGLQILKRLLESSELDFCMLASSLSNYLGGMGYVSEIAADLYMDAFIYAHAPRNWYSINWEGWHADDEGVITVGLGAQGTQLALSQAEVVEVFLRSLMLTHVPQLLVSTAPLEPRIARWIHLEEPSEEQGSRKGKQGMHPRPQLASPYVEPGTDAERLVTQIWGELLGIDQIGIHDNFFELGGHSLIGTRLASRLRKAFHVDLPLRALFEAPTAAQLTAIIEDLILTELEALDEAEATLLVSQRGNV
ncbi:MAG TPA: SDR family NAD(P)-dependent oxidoreductase [Ktedonobacteraceae bacterium]|nr:SDR family NAD(P)-dependent oxidoreductase [Ktedonobacteraceae bacterium]